jgi:hypothetical protein
MLLAFLCCADLAGAAEQVPESERPERQALLAVDSQTQVGVDGVMVLQLAVKGKNVGEIALQLSKDGRLRGKDLAKRGFPAVVGYTALVTANATMQQLRYDVSVREKIGNMQGQMDCVVVVPAGKSAAQVTSGTMSIVRGEMVTTWALSGTVKLARVVILPAVPKPTP